MPDSFWIKAAAVAFQGAVIFTIILWKPAIWPAMKRCRASIIARINQHTDRVADSYSKIEK